MYRKKLILKYQLGTANLGTVVDKIFVGPFCYTIILNKLFLKSTSECAGAAPGRETSPRRMWQEQSTETWASRKQDLPWRRLWVPAMGQASSLQLSATWGKPNPKGGFPKGTKMVLGGSQERFLLLSLRPSYYRGRSCRQKERNHKHIKLNRYHLWTTAV